jgi:hypothetical protein
MANQEVVLIFGSRDYPYRDDVLIYVATLPPRTLVISGGARGVDTWAEEAVMLRPDLRFRCYPVTDEEWKTKGKSAGIERNKVMGDACTRAVGFWDGKSPGSKHMSRYIFESGKQLHLFTLTTRGRGAIYQKPPTGASPKEALADPDVALVMKHMKGKLISFSRKMTPEDVRLAG